MNGSVRKIDEVGRILIPKDIREKLKIKDGTSLEIIIKDNNLVLKKYSPIARKKEIAQLFSDNLYNALNHNIIITDLSQIIASTGKDKKELINKDISDYLENFINRRGNILEIHKKELKLTNEIKRLSTYIINTITINDKPVGLLLVYDLENIVDDIDYKISRIAANFIGKYIEE